MSLLTDGQGHHHPTANFRLLGIEYIRVLEIPTPRYLAYDASFYDIELPDGTVLTQQERAYTSPVW